MGTNYYLQVRDDCNHYLLGEEDDECNIPLFFPRRLHIGKSSAGWVFALAVYGQEQNSDRSLRRPKDLQEWETLFYREEEFIIVDEYGRKITPSEMIDIIRNRPEFRLGNPLSRWYIDGHHCIGHGEDGTYDLHNGEMLGDGLW